MNNLAKFIGPALVVALLAAGAFLFLGGQDSKTVSAMFPRTISVYEGSDVRVLGVAVGTIDAVEPQGTQVKVTMSYDEDIDVPADASAVIVSPAIVGDRYVQLTPVYTGGEVLEDGALITDDSTSVPLELDEIYSSLDRLNVALGPNGANQKGALTDLIETTADNFGGQGQNFNRTIRNFAQLSETLDNNSDELFDSTEELGNFLETIADNDDTIQAFNASLSDVSDLLADERENLTAALRNLGVALDAVQGFVAENRGTLRRNVRGLNRVANVLVKRRAELREVLEVAPLALSNLALTYNPDAGTLDTSANIGNLLGGLENEPTRTLCGLVSANDPDGSICDAITAIGLPRGQLFGADAPRPPKDYDLTLGGLVEVTE